MIHLNHINLLLNVNIVKDYIYIQNSNNNFNFNSFLNFYL